MNDCESFGKFDRRTRSENISKISFIPKYFLFSIKCCGRKIRSGNLVADRVQAGIFEKLGSVIGEKVAAELLYLVETMTSINDV